MTNQLDLHALASHLDAVAAEARNPAGVDAEALLTRARRLLTKVRDAPIVSPHDDPPGAAGWQAVADGDDVVCWCDDGETSLYGAGTDGRLHVVALTVGEQVWGMRITSTGTSYVSPGEGVEGPADRRILERIKRQSHEERQRAGREVAARVRVCPKCSWLNEAGTTGCAFCGGAGVPWATDAQEAERPAVDDVDPAQLSLDLSAPTEFETTALPELPSTPQPVPPRAAQPGVREIRGSVVIDGVHADRKAYVVAAAADACEQAGLGRPDLSWIAAQLDRLPALLCRNVTPAQAADIQRLLADAGASTRFEVGHG